jgi:hypothetical protein
MNCGVVVLMTASRGFSLFGHCGVMGERRPPDFDDDHHTLMVAAACGHACLEPSNE